MTNYREILRLHSLGLNKTEIASSCRCARNTVAATLQRAANCGLQWPLPEEMSDKQLSERLFPSSTAKPAYKMPDYCEEFSMILTDYFLSTPDLQWRLAKQAGVRHAVVRLPEDEAFDMTDPAHIRAVAERFKAEGLRPLVVELMPNSVHDHIKRADALRDASIEKVLQMIPLLAENGFTTICMNFMAEIGWLRTTSVYPERGGAHVTGFDLRDVSVDPALSIGADTLWANLQYFLDAVVPQAERYGIRLAIHPDDPPLAKIGNVSRILISRDAMQKAIDLHKNDYLGITMCQANFAAMGEDVYECIEHFGRQGKIFFVHFRDIASTKECFHETFHDNGQTDMARAIRCYRDVHCTAPIRVDHVPTMAGEANNRPRYETVGRLYAIGYLRGLMDASGYDLL